MYVLKKIIIFFQQEKYKKQWIINMLRWCGISIEKYISLQKDYCVY